jgi:hypothetical protein
MTVVRSNKVNGKPVLTDNNFVSYFKEIENITYMEGIRHSDVVRLRGDIELCFLGELSTLECFDIVFGDHLEEM